MSPLRSLLVISVFATSSCSPRIDHCDEYRDKFDGIYAGAALALSSGDVWFDEVGGCGAILSGNVDFHESVAAAWEESVYSMAERPIYVEVEGVIKRGKTSESSYVLIVSKYKKISPDVDPLSANLQYKLRTGRKIELR
jgi:hypothetical protein